MTQQKKTKAQIRHEQRESVAKEDLPSPIKEKVEAIIKIIEELKAEAGKLTLQEEDIDIVRCLDDAMRMCRGRAVTAGNPRR